ncbi:MAG TPA: HEAT repeat domain-containing protein [Vicinamibacterales bacterium]|jgi:hypothetical protein|nr:HEAT repeat domain-containing protein [Vicinamibacterales bacterium]
MTRTISTAIVTAAIAVLGSVLVYTGDQDASRARILELARRGTPAETWAAWNALPTSQNKLRLGIDVAIALKDLPRGIDLYDQLATQAAPPATTTEADDALRRLTLAIASELIAGSDLDAGIAACSAALRLSATAQPCRQRLEHMANLGTTIGEQAIGAYALADAGLAPESGLMATLEGGLSPSARLQFATRFRHLPAAQRVALLQPLVAGPDATLRYQALLSLGEIRHPDAAAAIHGALVDSTLLRTAQTIALAGQGEPASLDALGSMVGTLDDYTKVPAALALARAGDARGSVLLDELMRSAVDLQRIMAASAVTQLNRETAAPTILASLTSGSPAIRPLALEAAGPAHLGRQRAVYTRLVGGEPVTRAAAVAAIADTLTAIELPASQLPPAPAPPPLPTTR